jgi:hypothetical protein
MPSFGASVIPESYLPEGLLPEGYDISIMEPTFADLDKAEQSGINTLAFQMSYWADENGELTMPPEVKEFMASFIDEAHAKGFKVWLNPEILHFMEKGSTSELRIIPDEIIENTDLIENFKDAIVETAEFAEEHGVEIFSPSSEMYVNLDFDKPNRERSKEVIISVKPRIDAVYSGKICLRGEWPNSDFSDYSCFAPTIGIPQNEEEKIALINHLEQEKEKGAEIITGELYEGSGWQGNQQDAISGFARGLEALSGRVSGVFITDGARLYFEPGVFENMIKEFYT